MALGEEFRKLPAAELQLLPVLLTWSRLEARPATSDLTPGLQAQLGDPFWLLARQWQFGELHGEDAGSPIEARLEATAAPVTRYGAGPASAGATAAGTVDTAP